MTSFLLDSIPSLSTQQTQKWNKFMKNHSFNESYIWQYWRDDSRPQSQLNKKLLNRFSSKIRAQKEIKELMRNGVPPEHRGMIWWVCSGGAEKMKKANKNESFEHCLELATSTSNPALHDIMKDLHRTFQSTSGEVNDEDVIPLKNVLLAYSIRNKIVGYCQSMNFIAAMLLTHMTEEQAFWVLAALIEDILPSSYYTSSMIGCRVDQAVFQSCLAWKLPRIFSHFRSKDIILEPVTCSWFLCLYVNSLPLPDVLRIWDCVFWEGNVVLFRIGLAICKLMEQQLLESQDFASIFCLLKRPLQDTKINENDLMDAAFDKSWLGSLPRAKLDKLRAAHKNIIQQEIERNNRAKKERATRSVKNESILSTNCEPDQDNEYQNEIQPHDLSNPLESDLKRLSSAYDGAEELLHRVLNDDSDENVSIGTDIGNGIRQTEMRMRETEGNNGIRESTISNQTEENMNSVTDDSLSLSIENENENSSPIPEYRPPARRTSRIMMSILTDELQLNSTLQDEIQSALNAPSL